ncbi:MAG: hypothetical protein J6R99_01690, partial [Alphaproteobacteria bacterium]|nr:hypothetical protein [Alphaproteobacteria bacterium]
VVDDLYEALETALMLGIDVSDILMMMNGSCNRWGRYACHSNGKDSDDNAVHNVAYYADDKVDASDKDGSCKKGRRVPGSCINGKSVQATCTTEDKETYSVKGGQECTPGMVVPPQDDALCTMIGTFAGNDTDAVRREWLDENYDGDRMVRIGCASSALDSIGIFARRRGKKASTLDLDTLERILEQDAAEGIGSSRYKDEDIRNKEKFQYCALSVDGHRILTTAINTQKFKQSEVCVESAVLRNKAMNADWARSLGNSSLYPDHIPEAYNVDSCETLSSGNGCWNGSRCIVRLFDGISSEDTFCKSDSECKNGDNSKCKCSKCGMYNYWNGGSVVTVNHDDGNADKEALCKMYGNTWYSADQAKDSGFKKEACCKQNTGRYWDSNSWGKCEPAQTGGGQPNEG